jgi:hypothetical protein
MVAVVRLDRFAWIQKTERTREKEERAELVLFQYPDLFDALSCRILLALSFLLQCPISWAKPMYRSSSL